MVQYKRMNEMVSMIINDETMIMARPADQVMAISKEKNPHHFDIMLGEPDATKEEFIQALDLTPPCDERIRAYTMFSIYS